MEGNVKKPQNIIRHMLNYKRAMRQCIQSGGTEEDMQQVANSYGLKIVKPF